MTPDRLLACLEIIRWPPATLSQALSCESSFVDNWLDGTAEVPMKVASWLEALCFTHESAELLKPNVEPGQEQPVVQTQVPRLEHIPVYSYNLLRSLAQGPVPLATLFGTDDEGAVFFLVSRGLAERTGDTLVSTPEGRRIGEVVPGRTQ